MTEWILFLVFGLVNDVIYLLMMEGVIYSKFDHRTIHYFGAKIVYALAVVSAFQYALHLR